MIETESGGCTEMLHPTREPVFDEFTGQFVGYYRPTGTTLPAPPQPTMADVAPSGWAAFELDATTAVPDTLPDAMLVDGIVGFDRLIAWATARQQHLLAVFAERPSDGSIRPVIPIAAEAPTTAENAAVGAAAVGAAAAARPEPPPAIRDPFADLTAGAEAGTDPPPF